MIRDLLLHLHGKYTQFLGSLHHVDISLQQLIAAWATPRKASKCDYINNTAFHQYLPALALSNSLKSQSVSGNVELKPSRPDQTKYLYISKIPQVLP